MRFELSVEEMAGLYRMVALGKLISGLIHNLNGPLQNLSMDLEMTEHSLKTEKGISGEWSEPMMRRVRRMEQELDHMSGMIRSASARVGVEPEWGAYGDLKDFLRQEVQFLNANLYFKHNVRKEIGLEEPLPPVTRLPEWIILSLSWFLQFLAEEMEREKANRFTLRARATPDGAELLLVTEGAPLSPVFMGALQADVLAADAIRPGNADTGATLAAALLKRNGAAIACDAQGLTCAITITLPLEAKP